MATTRTPDVSIREARAATKHWRRRRWPWVVALALLGLVLLLADAAFSGYRAARSLETTRDELRAGAAFLEAGQTTEASNAFAIAASEGKRAVAALHHPGPGLISVLPWIGDDVDAARRLSSAAELSGEAGTALTGAADQAGWSGGDLPGFSPGGRINPDAIARAQPGLDRAAELLGQAAQEVDPIDPSSLVGPLQQPATEAKDEVTARAKQARKLSLAASLLPTFLGADGTRSYLLVMLNTSDPRGIGGYPGSYALVKVDGQSIHLEQMRPTSTIPDVEPVAASPETTKRWASYRSLTTFYETGYTPDFPTAGTLMSEIWAAAGRPPVDGVIAADPSMMADLLTIVGSVDTPVWPETITPDNVERIMVADTFRMISPERSDALQSKIGAALWSAVLERPWPAAAAGAAFGDATSAGHVKVYSTDPDEEHRLEELGIAGQVQLPSGDTALVVYEGYVYSRAGYFAKFDESTDITNRADGSRLVTLTITLHNDAPKNGRPSILLGDPASTGVPTGTIGADAHVYLPADARLVGKTRTDVELRRVLKQEEYGRPVIVTSLQAPAQGTSTKVVQYEVPGPG